MFRLIQLTNKKYTGIDGLLEYTLHQKVKYIK